MSIVTWLIGALFAWKMARVTWGHVETGTVSDFAYFWDAGMNVLGGNAARAYSAHVTPLGPVSALPYPPPFLLLTPAFALFPPTAGLVIWLVATGAAYVLTSRQRLRIALANPPAPYNVRFGQTGFLTSAIFHGGFDALARRPVIGGVILGFLVIKPHLAILVPVALAAGSRWRALSAAAAASAALAAAAAIAFGPEIYVAWWHSIAHFGAALENGFWPWSEVSSTFAFLRWWGVGSTAAFAGQALTALAAALLVFYSWRRDLRWKVAVLAAGTLLVSPYLCSYDAVIMVVPLGIIAGRSAWRAALVWLLLLLPWFDNALVAVSRLPVDLSGLPDTTPIAALVSLWFLWRNRDER